MPKMIAVIEDDVHIGDIIEESLHREGYRTCRAYSGTEAQYLLADQKGGQKPDLILLDLMLPGVTGETLLQQIQDIGDIPVIVISAKVGIDDKVEALLGGAADYITKPFAVRSCSRASPCSCESAICLPGRGRQMVLTAVKKIRD